MKTWLRRLRGALSLTVLGAFAGAVIGAAWELVSTLLGGGPISLDALVFWTPLGATVGGASGLGFSVLVSVLGAKATLEGLSIWKAGLWGGVAGAAASCLGIYSATGARFTVLQDGLPFILACSGMGVALGGGVIRLAQTATNREFNPADRRQDLISDGTDEDGSWGSDDPRRSNDP
jgi:hypothetical protein